MKDLLGYEIIQCKCGENARIVTSMVGVYIRCPYCDKTTYMQNTKEDAVKLWEKLFGEKEKKNMAVEKREIIYIRTECIHPHPENPRKDLGDLTELAESIKKNGVMQNLTVIPIEGQEGEYYALIGNRRHSAAVIAGVKELPCRIVEGMSQKEQMSTMLEENMQRTDLTIWEQAQGFQLMLDLGETEDSIAKKTGFSKKTVRHRLNLTKLNQEELKKKTDDNGEFQLTLKDLYELEKISDVKTRDKVLKSATDSRDLIWKAKQEVTKETRARNLKAFKALFKAADIKKAPKEVGDERYSGKWETLQDWDLEKDAPKKLKKFDGKDLMWVVYWERTVAVIKKAEKKEKKLSEYEIREKEKQKAKKTIKQKCKGMYGSEEEFIHQVLSGDIQPLKETVELYKELMDTLMSVNIDFYMSDLVLFYSGKTMYDLKREEPEKYKEFQEWEKNLTPLQKALAYMSQIKKTELFNYNAEYYKESADKVKAVFAFLGKYGFSVSEEEQQLLDGTHELYRRKD